MRNTSFLLAILIALAPARAKSQTVVPLSLTQASLATNTDATKRVYYVLELPAVEVPSGHTLGEAVINFLVDATNVSNDSGAVTFEIYPYAGDAKAALEVSALGKSSMKRTVSVGTNQRVMVYVTDFVQKTIDNPAASRKLIVGSMIGDRSGAFTAKTLPGAPGSKAELVLYFDRIEDTSTGQSDSESE